MIDDQFDVNDAFEFLRAKEGREIPKRHLRNLLRTRQIDKLDTKDILKDEELKFIYQLLYDIDSLKGKDICLNCSLDLSKFTGVEESLHKINSLQIRGHLILYKCDIHRLPKNLKVEALSFKSDDPIPKKLKTQGIYEFLSINGGICNGSISIFI